MQVSLKNAFFIASWCLIDYFFVWLFEKSKNAAQHKWSLGTL